MKKRLALLLSVAMAFSMFANVAFGADAAKTTQEKFDALKTQGVFSGYPGTDDAKLGQEMTRAEFAKVLVKLFGLKEIHGTYSYKDKNYGAKNWAAPFIEAVTAEGLMQGKDLTKKIFDFNGKITVEEASKTLVTALKLEPVKDAQNKATDWAKGYFEAAVNAGLFSKDANPKSNATRAQLVEAAYAADELTKGPKVASYKVVDSKNIEFTMTDKEVVKVTLEKALEANKETEVKFQYKGKEVTAKVKYDVTSAQKIVSVAANNLKEVVVEFDGALDVKSAENKDNYEVKDRSVDSIKINKDKNSVTVLLKEESTMVQQKETELKVKNVQNEDKTKTFNETKKFTPIDVTLPEVKEVVGLGTKAFKVVFSEPVKKSGVYASSNFKVDGKTVAATVEYTYPNVAIISTELSVGEHKVQVSNVEDFSGLKIAPLEKTFTVAEDTTAPEVVSVKTTDLKELEITFNETVKSVNKIYHTNSDNDGSIEIKDDKVIVKFDRKKSLNPGENTIYIEGVQDYSGNKTDRTTKVNPTLDTERPSVTKVEYDYDDHHVKLTFNKTLDSATAFDRANYTIKDKNGDKIDHIGLDGDSHPVMKVKFDTDNGKDKEDTVIIDLNQPLKSGTYTLEVKNVRDNAYVNNSMLPFKQTFQAENKSVGKARAWAKSDGSEDYIYIQFAKNVKTDGVGRADDADKYTINGRQVAKDTEIDLVAGDTVRLKAKRGTYLNNDNTFKNDKDHPWVNADGKTPIVASLIQNIDGDYFQDPTTKRYEVSINNVGEDAVKAGAIKATSRTEIEVEFDGKLSNVNYNDFVVKAGDKTISPNRAKLNDDKDVITLYFSDNSNKLPAEMKGAKLELKSSVSTQDQFGNLIKIEKDKVIEDKIRPEIENYSIKFDKTVTDATYYEAKLGVSKNLQLKDNSFNYGTDLATAYLNQFTVKVGDNKATIESVKFDGTHLVLRVYFNKLTLESKSVVRFEFNQSYNDSSKAVVDNSNNGLKNVSTSSSYGDIEITK